MTLTGNTQSDGVTAVSPHSEALIHEVHEELQQPLLWEADSYADVLARRACRERFALAKWYDYDTG